MDSPDAPALPYDHDDHDDVLSREESVLLAAEVFAPTAPALPPETPTPPARQSASSVLIVGNDPSRGRQLCALLAPRREVRDVSHVERDWRALERLDEGHHDLVVLDLQDRLSGLELVPKLRRRAPRCTIVVTASARTTAAAPAAEALGASCYVQRSRRHGTRRLAAVVSRLAESGPAAAR